MDISDNKSNNKSEINQQCFTIKKNKSQCQNKGIFNSDDQYYCKLHFNLIIKNKKEEEINDEKDDEKEDEIEDEEIEDEEIKLNNKTSNKKITHLCNGIKKDNTKCDKKGTELHNNIYYCKMHLKQIIKLENTHLCNGIKKDGSKCTKVGNEIHNNIYYCKIHLKEKLNDLVKINKKESKDILNIIHKFVKISSSKFYTEEEYQNIRKEYKNIMLKIHPDKCKHTNLDSVELSKKINIHMNKIKKYEDNQ